MKLSTLIFFYSEFLYYPTKKIKRGLSLSKNVYMVIIVIITSKCQDFFLKGRVDFRQVQSYSSFHYCIYKTFFALSKYRGIPILRPFWHCLKTTWRQSLELGTRYRKLRNIKTTNLSKLSTEKRHSYSHESQLLIICEMFLIFRSEIDFSVCQIHLGEALPLFPT